MKRLADASFIDESQRHAANRDGQKVPRRATRRDDDPRPPYPSTLARTVHRVFAAGTSAQPYVNVSTEPGKAPYDRTRHLWRLLPTFDGAFASADDSLEASRAIIQALASALRRERQAGLRGDWTYDLNRHLALHQALVAERKMFSARMFRSARQGHSQP